MPDNNVKKWLGKAPERCNICELPLDGQGYFIDGRIKGYTTWAIMCTDCHILFGVGLGLGYGQKYDRATLEKVAG